MKLKDFMNKLEAIAERHKDKLDDFEVVVETSDDFLAGLNNSPVKDVYVGFDWTRNKIIIVTKDNLYRKENSQ